MTLALKRDNENITGTQAVVHLQAPLSSQYIDEAVSIIKDEIQELCTQTSLLLDCAEEDVSEQLSIDEKLGEKVADRLKELSAAMKFARLGIVAQLTYGLYGALVSILDGNKQVDAEQRSAIFVTTHLLSRYVDLSVERPQKDTGLIIAPSFHKLAKARLITHRVEAEMMELSFTPNQQIAAEGEIAINSLGSNEQNLRRGRQMFQVALIALLRGDKGAEPFNILLRVCKHNKQTGNGVYNFLWSQLEELVEHFKSGRLELNLQRCYALTHFDRLLRAASKNDTLSLSQGRICSDSSRIGASITAWG